MTTAVTDADQVKKVLEAVAKSITGRMPETNVEHWPNVGGKPVEYGPAGLVEEIAEHLIAQIDRFGHLHAYRIQYLYRNKDSWNKGGKTVFGECKLASGLTGYFADADFVILINLPIWKRMNPWQRVHLVYHELRHADTNEGKPCIAPHDAEVFLDELALFGTDTYSDWKSLAAAAEAGATVQTQFHLEFGSELAPKQAPQADTEDVEEEETVAAGAE